MTVHVFVSALDTIVAGIYAYDAVFIEADTAEDARRLVEEREPWAESSCSVRAAYYGTAAEIAEDGRTIREWLHDNYHEDRVDPE